MFVAKPVPAGKVASLDGSDVSNDLENLATAPGAALLQAQDFGQFGNPDAAMGAVSAYPGLAAPGTSARSDSKSGGGNIQSTAVTTAPMGNPFPSAKSTVKTSPSTIAK